MSINPIRLRQLLSKYLSNRISPDELAEFWELTSGLSENDYIAMDLQEMWLRQDSPSNSTADWEKLYTRLQARITEEELAAEKILAKQSWRFRPYAIAASILMVLGCAFAVFYFSVEKQDKTALIATLNKPGVQIIRLPDSTLVTLNHDSKLEYPPSFNGTSREVFLSGEAYFDVKHHPDKPFLVHSGNLVTRVLGTAFNIRAYQNDSEISVTVARGKVSVQEDGGKQIMGTLEAGDQLIINKEKIAARQEKVSVREVAPWKSALLTFDNIRFEEAVEMIGNYYGKVIRFEHAGAGECRFTASFTDEEISFEQVMEVITTLTGSSWTTDRAGQIMIRGKGCN